MVFAMVGMWLIFYAVESAETRSTFLLLGWQMALLKFATQNAVQKKDESGSAGEGEASRRTTAKVAPAEASPGVRVLEVVPSAEPRLNPKLEAELGL